MSKAKSNGYFQKAANLIYLSIIIGFIYGFVKALIHINKNQYLSYKLHNLILPEFSTIITKYSLFAVIIALTIIAIIPIYKMAGNWVNSIKVFRSHRYYVLILLVVSIVLILTLCYFYYPYLIQFLKNHSATSWLGNLSISKQNTLNLFIIISAIISFFLISLVSYIVCPTFFNRAITWLSRIISPKIFKTLSLVLILVIVLLKVSVFTNKSLNIPEGPNVILISIDTLRADHLGSYGHIRDTSPNMDNLAEAGILYENAFAPAPWTLPSMVSMHTSLYAYKHGAIDSHSKMDDHLVTLAEYLRNNFYTTIGVVSQSFVSSQHGFSQGFDIFDQKNISTLDDISSQPVTERAIGYIKKNHSSPFFLWIHHFDPHYSYIAHDEFDYESGYSGHLPDNIVFQKLVQDITVLNEDDIQYVRDIYDEEISYTDMYIGNLIDSLYELGIDDNTIVIITADHGEQFMERGGFGHGKYLYNEYIHVPLIIYVPGKPKLSNKRIKENVGIRSIPRTIVELLELENNIFGGINLLEAGNIEPQHIYAEGNYAWGVDERKKGVIYKNWKLINNIDKETYELYNLDNDPNEKINLIDSQNPEDINLLKELKAQLSNVDDKNVVITEKVKFSKDDIERLKALGYLQ